jgi:nitroimidazol reductase NimA-like FMN-containing flavoprotein (pyridoxamine 5'-phosphate oxidase superfamily)
MTVNHMSRPGTRSLENEEARWPSPPDPGDLSKRIAQRRSELHLSLMQVAARAGLSLRYLEYLERYPARPGPAELRHLAAALQTTPAVLLGGGANVPPGHRARPADLRVVSKLGAAECRRLITPGGVGRIAFGTLDGPVIIPVNFAVLAGTIVIRTAVGTIIDGHAGGQVALEADHIDEALRQGWSVLVRGPAHHVTHPAELSRLQEDAAVWPWAAGEREVYVRVIPSQITGRRIEIR